MDTGTGELPVPSAWAALAEPPPTSTHEVALVPRGLIVAVTALGTEGATIARAADAEAGATACAITIALPIATAGLPGPTSTGCTGRDQPAGSRGRGQQPGGPSSPASTPLIPQLLTPAVRAVGAGWAAKHQPVHTQPLEKVRVLLPPGEGEIQHSGPGRPLVPPAIPMSLSPDSLMEPPLLYVLLTPLQQLVAGEVRGGADTFQHLQQTGLTVGTRASAGYDLWSSWAPPAPHWGHLPVLVLGQLLLLPGCVTPTKALMLCPLQALEE